MDDYLAVVCQDVLLLVEGVRQVEVLHRWSLLTVVSEECQHVLCLRPPLDWSVAALLLVELGREDPMLIQLLCEGQTQTLLQHEILMSQKNLVERRLASFGHLRMYPVEVDAQTVA